MIAMIVLGMGALGALVGIGFWSPSFERREPAPYRPLPERKMTIDLETISLDELRGLHRFYRNKEDAWARERAGQIKHYRKERILTALARDRKRWALVHRLETEGIETSSLSGKDITYVLARGDGARKYTEHEIVELSLREVEKAIRELDKRRLNREQLERLLGMKVSS